MRKQAKANEVGWFNRNRNNDYTAETTIIANPTKEAMYQETELVAFQDYCKVALTKQALGNLSILAKFEESCIQASPHRAMDFQRIVDAYAFTAIHGILGGSYNAGN